MMKNTLFSTPILSDALRHLARLGLRLVGWEVEGRFPDLDKFVVVGAPHASNWDFLLLLAMIFILRADARFMGKAELFNGPFGWFFYWCGGIPVDRSKSTGLVEKMVDACKRARKFILVIAPEGTRSHVREWKMGFYHIAKSADIPIVFAAVDGIRRKVNVGQVFQPGEDAEADLKTIKGHFAGKTGIRPRKEITLEE
jgi:1-acyl-sn-glycerol-3-phosphate acyltransferase